MHRSEFIDLLTSSLAGRVPVALVKEKADFYRNYITEHARETGRSETEIIEELGPPELIAHTIIDVYEAEYGVYEGTDDMFSGYREPESGGDEEPVGFGGRFFSLKTGGYGCLILLFLGVLLLFAMGSWIVRLMTAFPLIPVMLAVSIIGYIEYQKRK